MYTGTLIKDLFALVEKVECSAVAKSNKALSHPQALASGLEDLDRGNSRPVPINSESEKLPQALCLSAADWNLALLLIVHAQLIRTLEPRYDFPNSIDVHQVRPVSAPEQSRVQAGE